MERVQLFRYSVTLDPMLDMEVLMKLAPASVATAFASIVFPVPGGPNKRIPLQGCIEKNRSGLIRKPPMHMSKKTNILYFPSK